MEDAGGVQRSPEKTARDWGRTEEAGEGDRMLENTEEAGEGCIRLGEAAKILGGQEMAEKTGELMIT